jgi:phosphoenolpyruvate---glycerone phosphotransferase subunit DhaK
LVVPNSGDEREPAERLGAAGALALRKYLKSGDTLAVTGGSTVMSVGANLRILGLQDVTVVQAIGGAAAKNLAAPSLCALTIASALNATCVNLSAPAVTSTAEARAIRVAEQLEILSQANKALFGISALRSNTSLHSDGLFEGAEIQHYFHGTVGVLAARFIDAWGKPVAGALDDRVIGLPLEDPLRVDLRIFVAGGFDKAPAILAALRRGYANVLVTDASMARGVLRADGAAELDRRGRDRQAVKLPDREPRQHVKSSLMSPTRWSRQCSRGRFARIAPF